MVKILQQTIEKLVLFYGNVIKKKTLLKNHSLLIHNHTLINIITSWAISASIDQ